jgi:hypothetical protein
VTAHEAPRRYDQDFEAQAGVRLQSPDQPVAEHGGRRPEAAVSVRLGHIHRQAGRRLAQHLAGRTIAGIAVAGHLDLESSPVVGSAEESQVEETSALRLRARPVAGRRKDEALECPAGRAQCSRCGESGDTCSESGRGDSAADATARQHRFIVAKRAPVGLVRQRVRAVHDAGVDGGHHERRDPGVEVVVVPGKRDRGLAGRARLRRRAQRVRVGEFFTQRRVRGGFLDHIQQTGGGAAGHAAAHRFHAHLHARARLREALHRLLLQKEHTHVGRDRVESAAVHDACAGFAGARLVALDHAADPLDFAGQVAIVGAGLGADPHQRLAMQRVGPDSGHHHTGAGAHRAQRFTVVGVGDHDRQLRGALSQRAAQRDELRFGSSGDRQPQGPAPAVLLEQVAGQDLPDEAGCAEKGQVQRRWFHTRARPVP